MGQYCDPNLMHCYDEGEENAKYFLTLEKKNATSITKTIKHLQITGGGVIYKDSDILKEAKSFYQNCSLQVSQHLKTHEDTFFPKGNALLLNPLDQ